MERIHRNFGLTAHLRDLPLNKPFDIYYIDYNPNVVWSTIQRLRNEGLEFTTQRIRGNKSGPFIKLRVTRVEYGTNTRTKTDCNSNGGLSQGDGLHTLSNRGEGVEGTEGAE